MIVNIDIDFQKIKMIYIYKDDLNYSYYEKNKNLNKLTI